MIFRPIGNPNQTKANYIYGLIVLALLIYIAVYSLTQS